MFGVDFRSCFFGFVSSAVVLCSAAAVTAQDSNAAPLMTPLLRPPLDKNPGQDQSQGADPLKRPLTEKQKKANEKSLRRN